MSDQYPAGTFVRGYLASDDISTAAAVPLFDADGVAYVQAIGTRLIIDELLISNGATAATVTIFADTDGSGALNAGEELVSANLLASSTVTFGQGSNVLPSRRLGASAKNKLFAVASAASVKTRIVLTGRIINS